ncbi:MAG: DNA polymerase III subunit alpha [Pseudomonadales bacterium]
MAVVAGGFVHLRVHSEYSLADSIIKVKPLAAAVAARQMGAVALTDRSNLFGLIKFYSACLASGVKPITGVDVRYASTLTSQGVPEVCRATLLAMNEAGYRNLLKLVSAAYLDCDTRGVLRRDQIFAHGDGLLVLCGAREGEVGKALLKGDDPAARSLALEWANAFPDRFYLELVRTGRTDEQRHVTLAVDLAGALELPVVATNDVCFLDEDDFEAHETRVCIAEGRVLDDPRRERRYSARQYLRTPAEMIELFADVPEAIRNTVEIARRCNVQVPLGQYFLPNYPVPDGYTLEEYLEECARSGLKKRLQALESFGELEHPLSAYESRLDYELGVINQMGFPGYFLIVMEFIGWAKANHIPVGPGRGSGAGSLVAYALEITDLDPLRYDLLFERFLNPERVSMPDFDIDFCMEGRDRVIAHVSERYGQEAVSQIITFGTMAAKAVVRDVARVQGKPYGLADKLSKLIPFEVGMTLHKAVEESAELREFIAASDEVAEIMDMAYVLEGIVRGVGRHAGGVVIAPSALTDFVPLYVDEQSGGLVSQFDKDDVEAAGLVKFDFLGLKTLTIIDWAVRAINEARAASGETPLDIDRIPLDDAETYALLQDAETTAIFQLESRGMKDLIKRLKPDNIDDIIALVALFRPGPLQSGAVDDYINRKHGREPVHLPHQSTAQALEATYGVMLYQEQVMQIAQDMCGFSLGGADLLRRAMGKKKPEEMAKVRAQFVTGATERQVAKKTADDIFDDMEKFSGYAFNKSHSATYAIVSFQTAWLKRHYPAEFMAATLSADMQNTDKVVTLVDEVRRMGVTLKPPSVNVSEFRFSAFNGGVIYGLGAVRGVGEGPVAALVAAREEAGPFENLADFCLRVDARKANKRVLEALIRSGAMDEFGTPLEDIDAVRARLLSELADAMQSAEQVAANAAAGMADMFGGPTGEIAGRSREVPPLEKRERLELEKEALGLYLTGHPIEEYLDELKRFCSASLARLKAERRKQLVAGLVVQQRNIKSRRGGIISVLTLDDRSGRLEAVLYPDRYEAAQSKISKDTILILEGEVQEDDFSGALRMEVETVLTIEEARQRFSRGVTIDLGGPTRGDLVDRLRSSLEPHRLREAGCAVTILCQSGPADGLTARGAVLLGPDWRVNPSDDLLRHLKREFGDGHVSLAYPDAGAG